MRRTRGSAGECEFFEVIDVVIGGDRARVAHEFVGRIAKRRDLVSSENPGHYDEPVAAVSGEIGGRQHGSS